MKLIAVKRPREPDVNDHEDESPKKKMKYRKDQLDEPCFVPSTMKFSFMDKDVWVGYETRLARAKQVREYNRWIKLQDERIDK